MLDRLDEAIKAVAPIFGVSGQQGSIVVHYNGASAGQITAAEAVVAGFDWSQAAHDLWLAQKHARQVGSMLGVRLTADRVNSTQTYADCDGLSLPLDAGAHYYFRFEGAYTAAAGTTGIQLALNGPANSFLAIVFEVYTAAGAVLSQVRANYDTGIDATASGGATPLPFRIYGNLTTTAAGLLVVRFKSEINASAVTIKRGSCGSLTGLS